MPCIPYRVEVLDAKGSAQAPQRMRVIVGDSAPTMRIDKLLATAIADISRARVQALIADGMVSACDSPYTDAQAHPIHNPDARAAASTTYQLCLPPAKPATPQPQAIALDVLYEDDALIVVNKPAGMVVHPAAGNADGTLVNALLAHCHNTLSGIGGVARPGIVHRLDKDTSGVLVAAKTDAAHRALAAQFAAHGADGALTRAYRALVWGAPRRHAVTIDAPIGRHRADRTKMAIVPPPAGRRAVTHVTVTQTFAPAGKPVAAHVDCRLETGRTHQIRVHLAHEGCPVIGDPVYGRGHRTMANSLPEPAQSCALGFGRQALHAYLLGFRHPKTAKNMIFEAPLPGDMARLLAVFQAL